jgi:hypothetical protein
MVINDCGPIPVVGNVIAIPENAAPDEPISILLANVTLGVPSSIMTASIVVHSTQQAI